MNANVAFQANVTGARSPSAAERQAAQEAVWAQARATLNPGVQAKSAAKADDAAALREIQSDMDRDMFLQLLVKQLQQQDPLDPVDNNDMLAQLAQFSSLEQMNNLNESFETLSQTLTQQGLVGASSLLGRSIEGQTTDGIAVSGVVDRVFMEDGQIYLRVGENILSMARVTQIE